MIAEMSRVAIFGPKKRLKELLTEIQRLGLLHLDKLQEKGKKLAEVKPTSEESTLLTAIEKLLGRIDGLLELLPSVLPPKIESKESELQEKSLEEISKEIDVVEIPLRRLTKERIEKEEELELILAYEGAVRVLAPLVAQIESSKNLATFGFIIKKKTPITFELLKSELHKLTEGRIEFVTRQVDEEKLGVLATFHRRDAEKVRNFFTRAGVNELPLPAKVANLPIEEAVRILQKRKNELPEEIKNSNEEIKALAQNYRGYLKNVRNFFLNQLARLKALSELSETKLSSLVCGWAPTKKLSDLKLALKEKFGEEIVIEELPFDEHEAKRIPVLLENKKLWKPFELFLQIFQPPKYGTIDPTPYFALFFPMFFGFIIGDIGYGLMLILFSLPVLGKAKLSLIGTFIGWLFKSKESNKPVSGICLLCALWTIFFGIIFGEFLGDLGEHLQIIHPLLLNRMTTDAKILLTLAVALGFGIVHVFLGFIIGLINAWQHQEKKHIVSYLCFIFSLIGLFSAVFSLANLLPAAIKIVGSSLFVIGLIGLGIIEGVIGPIEIFSAVGNILSYARLFAIGLSAVYLAYVANLLGNQIAGGGNVIALIGGILVASICHLLFFLLGIISPVVQPARLHYVEFFTKFRFYEQTGKPYKPLRKIDQL
ncbi:MAG: V-type ATPase 116kDa subunit family protein [Candidatus Edwardsbacteria bacterium]